MMRPLYGVVNGAGELLGVAATQEEAIKIARSHARGRAVTVITGREEGPDRNPREELPLFRRHMGGLGAFTRQALPVVDYREAMRLSLREAYFEPVGGASIRDVMPQYTQKHNKAGQVAGGLLASNKKMSKKTKKQIGAFYGLHLRKEIETWGLSLAPHKKAWADHEPPMRQRNGAVPNLCPGASPECIAGCLIGTGGFTQYRDRDGEGRWPPGDKRAGRRGVFRETGETLNAVETYAYQLKIKMARALYQNPTGFVRLLSESIIRKKRRADRGGRTLMIRLNVLSDIIWEVFCPGLFEAHRRANLFYDYTKVPNRTPPPNYELTFSFSGRNEALCQRELDKGNNVTVVFLAPKGMRTRDVLPIEEFWGKPVISGDLYDARPLDKRVLAKVAPGAKSCVISLRYKIPQSAKGTVKASELGAFVIDLEQHMETGLYCAPETPNQTQIHIDTEEELLEP